MKIHFLGTGTSSGVPFLGCHCAVCSSTDSRDKRTRTSLLVEGEDGERLLIDCGPDFRMQMLHYLDTVKEISVDSLLNGVLLTHAHYDHVAGLDDLRPFSRTSALRLYGERDTLEAVKEHFPYCFQAIKKNVFIPHFEVREVCVHEAFHIGKINIVPIRLLHGALPTVGYRINDIAYLTDLKFLPSTELQYLRGLKLLILDAVNWDKEHSTHETVLEAIELSKKIASERTFLVHMSHRVGCHAEVNNILPQGIELAYDGQIVEV